MILTLIAINTLAWLILQLTIAAIATRIPFRNFAHNSHCYNAHASENAFYRNHLRIRRWKHRLPDGAHWVGGSFRKNRLQGRDPAYLRQFLVETRRGEVTHWVMLACFPIFFLWNPPWACVINALYAIAANLPCILVQRYNRDVVGRLLLPRNKTSPPA